MANPLNRNEGGAKGNPGGQAVDFTPHPMVERILDQSGKPRDTRVLVGYLAAPDEQGPVRIYLDLTFRAYFEVPRDKVLARR